ncbi:MAG: hypothetical protein KG029_20205 [Bacteroidetes bacterium]|nr:hypothetical protein [Bacteroidota bacterium]
MEYIGLLIQVPLVGVFIWFALQLVAIFLKAIEARDKQWQDFLVLQRKETSDALTALSDEVKRLSGEVSKFNGVLSAHDARQQDQIRKVR